MNNDLSKESKPGKPGKPSIKNVIAGVIIFIVIVTGFIILLNKDSQINELQVETNNLDLVIHKRDSVINELDGTISEIEQNISFIKDKREQLEFEYRETRRDRKEQIIDDIALMNTMLEESERKMEELSRRIEASGIEISSFKTRVAKLGGEIQDQNRLVATLKKELENRDMQLAEMGNKVNTLEKTLEIQTDSILVLADSMDRSSEKIQVMEHELYVGFWTMGTAKELTENGIISREGGFLGIGKSKKLNKNINLNYFTELDIRKTGVLPLNVKKAEVITTHTDNSYTFIYKDDLIAYLKIENPEEFWKLTRYAVIEVKQ